VIIGDFDFVGISRLPPETDSILIVDSDAVLPLTIPSQSLQAISGRHSKIPEVANPIQQIEFSLRDRPQGTRTDFQGGTGFGAVKNIFGPGSLE